MNTSLATGNSNNQISIMSLETAREKAPAIFAEHQHPRLGKGYKFTSSMEIISHFDSLGFKLTNAKQSISNQPIHRDFGTHVMEFQSPDLYMKDNRGGIEGRPTIVVINTHNGNRPISIDAGIFRLVCSNGLIIKTQDFGSVKERHTKYDLPQIKEILDQKTIVMEQAVGNINRWISREMSAKERFAFATEAIALRLSGDRQPEQYELQSILMPKRKEDEGNDRWRVFNRVQENVIKGGFDLNNREARAIKNPMAEFELNQQLWSIAEAYAN